MEKRKQQIILFYWLPVFLWCVLIYELSAVPDLRSDLPGRWDLVLRKLAHMGEYAVLTGLFFRAAAQSVGKRRALGYAALFAVTYALTDEYHQTFVAGRSGNAVDVSIDSLGIFLAVLSIDKKYLDASIKRTK
jgi:VanZ family protein